ncbi:MAG: NAD(P)-dependent alcohol dehydrogenase [Candidatus Eisenbacteria bacterium]|uniref:NAD(P)-dependent alcohol dehydrogenase n=1 Tax=Eiseniibacteriota bacterium TaxID=2212470 RepID=A0A933SEU3_UNCEI|nr:NAD(P)-dependent alcohol dehydrogenase [Candidatus Eisenbacteria bacterium]
MSETTNATPVTTGSVPTYEARALAVPSATEPFAPTTIRRREPLPTDVRIEILFCGICHSDLHQARDEWNNTGPTVYPCVPGHEMVGRVTHVGSAVSKFRVGDMAAVGCMVDSCRTCEACREGLEQFCAAPAVFTYNSPDPHVGGVTHGGYSESIVVDEAFVLRLSSELDPAAAAPLLCAGITTYSPLKRANLRPGQKVGIVGLGGLGHMGVKFAAAMGAHVVVFSTTSGKRDSALALGAKELVVSTNAADMEKHLGTFDFILDTVSAVHDLNAYLRLLKRGGTMALVGAPQDPHPVVASNLIFGRKHLTGSLIGGIRETQQMLDYCAEHGIVSDIELIAPSYVNKAYERMLKSDVKYRFVIDMKKLKS